MVETKSYFSDFSSKTLISYKILQFIKVNQIDVYIIVHIGLILFYYFYVEINMYLPNVDFVIKIGEISDSIDFSIKNVVFAQNY